MGDGAASRIVQDPEILSGKPVVRGTRISVSVVLEYLADNPDFDELFADYPRLTMDDVRACFAFAQDLVEEVPRRKLASAERRALEHSPYPSSGLGKSPVAMIDPEILWERIRALEGQTLPTMSGRAEFDMTAVDDRSAQIFIRSKAKLRTLYRQEFEQAASLGLLRANVTPSEVRRAAIDEFNPTYIAAIIRAVMRQAPEA